MTSPTDIELRERVFVPVAIDAERLVDGVKMLRSTYFLASTDSPTSIWEIALPTVATLRGIGALGLSGVVFGPLRQTDDAGLGLTSYDRFLDAADVSAIFDLEDDGAVSIQLEDIWLPYRWCRAAPIWGEDTQGTSAVTRGDVFRVGARLFQHAYRYAIGELDMDELLGHPVEDELFRSPTETQSLQDWAQQQIEETRQAFPDKKVKLRVRVE